MSDHVDVKNDNGTTTRIVLLADEPGEDKSSLTISQQMEMLREWAADLDCAIVPLESTEGIMFALFRPVPAGINHSLGDRYKAMIAAAQKEQ